VQKTLSRAMIIWKWINRSTHTCLLAEINGDLSNIGCRDVNWIPVAEERSKSHFRNDVVRTFMSFTAVGKAETLYLEFS
jgi:hypothetical protein